MQEKCCGFDIRSLAPERFSIAEGGARSSSLPPGVGLVAGH